MSLLFNLEVEEGITCADLERALTFLEISSLKKTSNSISRSLTTSNSTIIIKLEPEEREILTEGYDGADWKVGARAYIEIDGINPDPFCDIKKFLLALVATTQSKFIFSVQYESIYAVRSAVGPEFLKDF